jgi:hypothetical protein
MLDEFLTARQQGLVRFYFADERQKKKRMGEFLFCTRGMKEGDILRVLMIQVKF